MAPQFISPHPLVTFAEVPVIYEVQSCSVVADSVCDSIRPLLEEAIPSSHKSLGTATEAQDAARKVITEEQAQKIQALEELCEELRTELAEEKGRAEELQASLKISEKDRERNLESALQLYRNTGNLALVERQNLLDQIRQLKVDVHERESQVSLRDEYIRGYRSCIMQYANQVHWVWLQNCFNALRDQYGKMPEELRDLERQYGDLEDEYLNVSDRFQKLEEDHTELKAQYDQIRDERDRLKHDAQRSNQSSNEEGPRGHPIDIVSPGVDTKGAQTGVQSKEEVIFQGFEEGTFLIMDEDDLCGEAETPRTAHDPPRFETDFNFGGSNGGVPFTANHESSPPPPPVLGTEQNAPTEPVSNKDVIEQGSTDHTAPQHAEVPNTKKKAKGKQPKEKAQKTEAAPKFEGPNRKQRRAADRERKAAEKKAQIAAEKAKKARKVKQVGRSALAKAVVHGEGKLGRRGGGLPVC